MRSGELRHVIDLQEPTRAKGDSGAPKATTWRTFRTCRAEIEALSGRELLMAKQIEARTTHRVKIRKDPTTGVLTSHRVRFRDGTRTRTFGILGVTNTMEEGRELLLSCVEDTTGTGA